VSELTLQLSRVNAYVAHKQHLLPGSRGDDMEQVISDIVALHATIATGPYLSLWARIPAFRRQDLDDALYEQRELVRLLCMRSTLHLVPSRRLPCFFQAYSGKQVDAIRCRVEALLVEAGLCEAHSAGQLLRDLLGRVLDAIDSRGSSTVTELGDSVPELRAKVRHDVGKPYEGAYSIGSRLVPAMCDLGLLVRARPRGTWRSSLYEYDTLSDWLPDVDLASVTTAEAALWLVRSYLGAYGPATFEDIVWWTGFSKGHTAECLRALYPELMQVSIAGLDQAYLMMSDDVHRLSQFVLPNSPHVFLLPSLDPYIMGYQSRNRFLAPEDRAHVFDRAGNAMPTVWVDGRVAGAWGQRKNRSVAFGFFESPAVREVALVTAQTRRLAVFLDGEALSQRSHTGFTRALARSTPNES
jgi:hypothetical protein